MSPRSRTLAERFAIDDDIRRASTLHADAYRDPEVYRAQVAAIFARSWHVVSATDPVPRPEHVAPLVLLEGCLDEPIVATRDRAGVRRCLSNVCTHRGNIVATEVASATTLRCRYHGRRFGLDGRFAHMPEFEQAEGFPSPADDLPVVPIGSWGPLLFAGVRPAVPFEDWLCPLRARLGFVPWDKLELHEARDYELNAHWALYCDNYLEGFHIPFVHAGLAEKLDYGAYSSETFEWSSLQIGIAKDGEDAFELPAGHPDHGRRIAAFYAFLFPATMINVYPWGVSVNAVRPLGVDRTRVTFLSLVHDPARLGQGAGSNLHRVELEDEAIVQNVQRGVRSRFYERGRYSPQREACVHHFHRLIARAFEGRS